MDTDHIKENTYIGGKIETKEYKIGSEEDNIQTIEELEDTKDITKSIKDTIEDTTDITKIIICINGIPTKTTIWATKWKVYAKK